mgnify:CR=1 FL=1
MKKKRLTTSQAATLLGHADDTLRRKARAREIEAEIVPGSYPAAWSFDPSDLPERKERETDKAAFVAGVLAGLGAGSLSNSGKKAALDRLIVSRDIMDADTLQVFIEREKRH